MTIQLQFKRKLSQLELETDMEITMTMDWIMNQKAFLLLSQGQENGSIEGTTCF